MADESANLLSSVTRVNLAILCLGLLLFCVLALIDFMPDIAGLLAAALMVAYLLLGPVHTLERWLQKTPLPAHLHRTAAIIIVYLGMFALLAVTLIRVAPPLSVQVREFAHDIPHIISRVQAKSQAGQAPAVGAVPTPGVKASIAPGTRSREVRRAIFSGALAQFMQKLLETYRQSVLKVGGLLVEVGTSTLSGVIYTLTMLVFVFILLHDGRGLRRGMADMMPQQYEAVTAEFLRRLHVHLSTVVKAQVLMGLLSGGLMTLLLSLMDVKYALLLGVGFGTVSLLPVLGPWLGLLPITLILALTHHLDYLVQVLLWAGGFYLVKTYWLWPRLIDRRFNIHPIIFIVTFLACIKLVGVLGIILSFLLSAMFGVAFDMFRESHRNSIEPG